MRHILHLIKDASSPLPFAVVVEQARDSDIRVSVVLLGDAVSGAALLGGDVYRLSPDADDGPSVPPPITYAQLLDLVFRADAVVTW